MFWEYFFIPKNEIIGFKSMNIHKTLERTPGLFFPVLNYKMPIYSVYLIGIYCHKKSLPNRCDSSCL
jgi:hypothetical protein